MSDKLNEVGKNLGRTKKDSEAALRRYAPIYPQIERTRDIFDDVTAFEMFFNIENKDSSISLDLYFNKPPPSRNCSQGCWQQKCESFDVTADSLVQLSFAYRFGSVTAYFNNVQLNSSQFSEYDASNGLVYVTNQGAGLLVICAAYTVCAFNCDGNNLSGSVDSAISNGGMGVSASASWPSGPTVGSDFAPGVEIVVVADSAEAYGEFKVINTPTSHSTTALLDVGVTNNLWPLQISGSMSVVIHCPNNPEDPSYTWLVGDTPERVTGSIYVGDLRYDFDVGHGKRSGIFPGPVLPVGGEAPYGKVTVYNCGNSDWDGNFLGGTQCQQSQEFDVGFNPVIPISFSFDYFNKTMTTNVAGNTYQFGNPYYAGSPTRGVSVGWAPYEKWSIYTGLFTVLLTGVNICYNTEFSTSG